MEITERYRKNLEVKGVRVKKVEQQVAEIEKMLQNSGFTFREGELIVQSLANDIEGAKYHSPMTLLRHDAGSAPGPRYPIPVPQSPKK